MKLYYEQKYKINEARIDRKSMLKFLYDNPEFSYDHQIEPIYFSAMASKFYKQFNVGITNDDYGTFTARELGFQTKAFTYEELVKSYEDFKSQSTDPEDQQELKYRMGFIKERFRYTGRGVFSTRSNASLINLFYLFDYVCFGKLEKDLHNAVLLWDTKYKEIYRQSDYYASSDFKDLAPAKIDLKEYKVTAVIMKNGKVTLKGLSQEALDTIEYIFNIL